jgi:putative transposase
VADFTDLWTAEGWLFVAVVLNLYARRVVGWSMSESMSAQFVLDALIMALWRRGKPTQLIHHSDQGSTRARTSSGCCRRRASPAA